MSHSHSSHGERTPSQGRSANLQEKREIEKIRRQKQCGTQEAIIQPVFPQPRKIIARQDSLTRNIASVLGDSSVVSQVLFREPSNWLGTSRTAQGQTVIKGQENTTASSVTMPKETRQNSHGKEKTLHAGTNTGSRSNELRAHERKYTSKSKFSRVHQDQKDQSHPMHGNSPLRTNQTTDISEEDPVYSGPRRSERDRVSSVDSDMLPGVENILKEMVVDLSPSITGINTPSVNEYKFNYPSSQRKKLDGPESSLESVNNDARDGNPGSDDSSGDDSSDDDDDDGTAKSTGWNLVDLMPPNTKNTTSKSAKDDLATRRTDMDETSKTRGDSNTQVAKGVSRDFKQRTRSSPKSRSLSSSSMDHLRNSPPNKSDVASFHSNPRSAKYSGPAATPDGNLNRKKTASHSFGRSPSEIPTATAPHRNSSKSSRHQPAKYANKNPSRVDRKTNTVKTRLSHRSSSSDSDNSTTSQQYVNEDFSGSESSTRPKQQECSLNEEPYNRQKQERGILAENDVTRPQNTSWNNNRPAVGRLKSSRNNSASSTSGDKVSSQPDSYSQAFDNHTVKRTNPSVEQYKYPSLIVKFNSSLFLADSNKLAFLPESQKLGQSVEYTKRSEPIVPRKRQMGTLSTGSETEQPVRRTTCVQVAVADGSTDWKEHSSSSSKRKSAFSETVQSQSQKRQRREKHSWKQHNQSFPADGFKASVESNYRQSPSSPPVVDSINQPSSSLREQESPNSNRKPHPPTASIVLPDSSVPGEQERIQTSDWYMREGKKKKHEGDGMVDSRTGRTRPGEALSRALSYFEASLFFIMSGHVMESENREDRLETGSNNSSSSTAHCPTNMYQQTLPLLDFVLKMRPRAEQDDRIFKRVTISCLRCQSFLYFRIFKLKKDTALKYSELLTEQFKTMGKSAQTHSPWRNTNAAPNVLSPMSPAVPSPFTHHGPSPASNNGEQVSSSTQAGRMTPTTHSNYSFPQKTYDIYRQNHTIMCNLLQAHEKWDQGESMLEEHADFFRNIDALCNRTLTFHSGLRDVFLYYKMVLRQLRALMNGSPST